MTKFSQKSDIHGDRHMDQVLPAMQMQARTINWKIKNFSCRIKQGICTSVLEIGEYKWQFKLSLQQDKLRDYLSVYLVIVDSQELALGWNVLASYKVMLVGQSDSNVTITIGEPDCHFNQNALCFGFPKFLPMGDLYNPGTCFLENDSLAVELKVNVRKIAHHLPNDSRKELGFVGLKNQGATCYLNSLIQTLYHLPILRKVVYHHETSPTNLLAENTSLAGSLQSLFYKIQHNDTSPGTEDLTKSFGWDSAQSLREEDVHELSMFLYEKLEENMKGTGGDETIREIFEGHLINYIECVNVEYKSNRKESFKDLQLDVKGCKGVYESLDKYVAEERLESDNQYYTEPFGLQDARKGSKFSDFPPVLQLHLKRFEYDFNQGAMAKVNDCYKFPLQLDLDRENGKYLSTDSDRSIRNLYTLQSVLVHSGSSGESGHYYVFIRPTLGDQWYKFDDEFVTKEESKTVLEEHYGADDGQSHSNAYMLLYIRESQKDEVVCVVEEEDIPEHLKVRCKEEEEVKRKREQNNIDNDLQQHSKRSCEEVRFGFQNSAMLESSKNMKKRRRIG